MSIGHPAKRAQTGTAMRRRAVKQDLRLTLGRLCCRLVSAGPL